MREARTQLMEEGWSFAYHSDPFTMVHHKGYLLSISHERGWCFVLVPPKEEWNRLKPALWFYKWEDFWMTLDIHGLRGLKAA